MKQLQLYLSAMTVLFILFGVSGCSTKEVDYAFEYHPFEKEEKLFKEMCSQSVYLLENDQIFRILENHYLIYDDAKSAPIAYGEIKLERGAIHLKSVKGEDVYSFHAGTEDQILLSSTAKGLRLIPDFTDQFYKPQNIFEAIRWGTLEEVKEFIAEGESIDSLDSLGNSALYESVDANNYPIAEYLLLAGADLHRANSKGLTPLYAALKTKNKKIVKLLLEHGAKKELEPCSVLLPLIEQDDFEMAKILVEAGYNPSCQQSSLLFWMISNERFTQEMQLAYLNFLLDHQIQTDVVSKQYGATPLMQVSALGKTGLLERLIAFGVELFTVDGQGRTALDYDSIYIEPKNPDVEKLLKQAGLNAGLKVTSDKLYDEAMRLYENDAVLEAYWRFVKLSDEYKEKRFYLARIKTAESLKKPTLAILKDIVSVYKSLQLEENAGFYRKLIAVYMQMEPLVADDARKNRDGSFKSDTLFFVVKEIDALYDKLLRNEYSTEVLFQKYENLKKLNNYSGIIRGDHTNGANIRFVGEYLDGKPFGLGALKYPDGASYYGMVIHYIRHGKGKMTYPDGKIYDGMWNNDQRQGKGFFTDRNNALYLGNFDHDTLVGEAKMVRPGNR